MKKSHKELLEELHRAKLEQEQSERKYQRMMILESRIIWVIAGIVLITLITLLTY